VTLCVGKHAPKHAVMGDLVQNGRARTRILGRLALAAIAGIVVVATAAPALAADPYPAGNQPGNQAGTPSSNQKPAQVLAQHFFNDDPPAAVSGSSTAGGGGGEGAIAFTGFNLLILLVTALVALAIGFVLWRSQHRPAGSNR
jgi:hypothetical protein